MARVYILARASGTPRKTAPFEALQSLDQASVDQQAIETARVNHQITIDEALLTFCNTFAAR